MKRVWVESDQSQQTCCCIKTTALLHFSSTNILEVVAQLAQTQTDLIVWVKINILHETPLIICFCILFKKTYLVQLIKMTKKDPYINQIINDFIVSEIIMKIGIKI